MLAANIGLNKQQRTCSMKDFILGSEEFIINLGEIIEQIREKNQLETIQLTCRLNEDDEQQAQIKDPLHNNPGINQTIQDINTKLAHHCSTCAKQYNHQTNCQTQSAAQAIPAKATTQHTTTACKNNRIGEEKKRSSNRRAEKQHCL